MKIAKPLAGLAAAALLAVILGGQDFSYVGASQCKICHKTETQGRQFPIWENSLHAKAFLNLSTPPAEKIAGELGVQNASQNPACLACHAPLFEKAPDFKAEGVTCEVCHGPGSVYKKLSLMQNREEAGKNGLVLFNGTEDIKARCLQCHDSPHGKAWDFAAGWEKILHPVPGK